MSLTNMGKEPRREITESAIGLLIVAPVVMADYYLSIWLQEVSKGDNDGVPFLIGFFLICPVLLALGSIVTMLVVVATHRLGEDICDLLENRGLRLRPKQRY